jgi:hypothetical protein
VIAKVSAWSLRSGALPLTLGAWRLGRARVQRGGSPKAASRGDLPLSASDMYRRTGDRGKTARSSRPSAQTLRISCCWRKAQNLRGPGTAAPGPRTLATPESSAGRRCVEQRGQSPQGEEGVCVSVVATVLGICDVAIQVSPDRRGSGGDIQLRWSRWRDGSGATQGKGETDHGIA